MRLSPRPAPRAQLTGEEAVALAQYFEDKRPEDVLKWAFERFGKERLALVSSFQAEAMVLIDMAWRIDDEVRVVTVDTGRLPQQTYDLIDKVREKYRLSVEVVLPDGKLVEQMVNEHGTNLFYKEVALRARCCHVRKVLPLTGVLEQLDAWTTGLRREQSAIRGHVRKVEIDHAHGGLVKLSPLADWSHEAVWQYIKDKDVPYHALYDQGYTSIGCAPCTRAISEGEDTRSGRWWWEADIPKECGIHHLLETSANDDHKAHG